MRQIASFNSLRFLAVLVIVLLHIGGHFRVPYPFRHGYLAVELFFVLSGFLLAKTYEKLTHISAHKNDTVWLCKTYFFRRFVRLWPEYFFAMILAIALLGIFASVRVQPLFLNTFMMGGWGGINLILLPFWYVTVVFWCSCLLFNLLVLGKEKAKVLILPITAILCLFFIVNNNRHFDNTTHLIPFVFLSGGTIRGLLGLIIGIYTYWGCQIMKASKIKWKPKFVSVILFLGELLCVLELGYIFIFQKRYTLGLFNIYFYISFLIGLLYFQKEKLLKFLSWKIWKPFAIISYSLYLVHAIVTNILTHYLPKNYMILNSIVVIVSSMALAFLCHYGQKWLFKFLKKIALKNNS